MNTKTENEKTVANRFCWINNNTIHIVNHEGIERHMTIDFSKKSEEAFHEE